MAEELAGESGFAHVGQSEQFVEADGLAKVCVHEANGLGDYLLVTG